MNLTKPFIYISLFGLLTTFTTICFAEEKTPPPVHKALRDIGGDFTLHSSKGDISLADFREKVVLLYFGFINCPDACPVTLSNWTKALKKLDEVERNFVRGIMISVDPERDTVEEMALFTSFFHENIVGVTGSIDELKKSPSFTKLILKPCHTKKEKTMAYNTPCIFTS